jgi:hypothetical protein
MALSLFRQTLFVRLKPDATTRLDLFRQTLFVRLKPDATTRLDAT